MDFCEVEDVQTKAKGKAYLSYLQRKEYFQHTAITSPGSSGGALVNEDGDLIGINAKSAGSNLPSSFSRCIGGSFASRVHFIKKDIESQGIKTEKIFDCTYANK